MPEPRTKTIDLTPTWSAILHALLFIHTRESKKTIAAAQSMAVEELERMARAADFAVAVTKVLEDKELGSLQEINAIHDLFHQPDFQDSRHCERE